MANKVLQSQRNIDHVCSLGRHRRILGDCIVLVRVAKITLLVALCTSISACSLVQRFLSSPAPTPIEPTPSVITVHSSQAIAKASRQQVTFAQQALTKLGYKPGEIDGLWGPRTSDAVKAFSADMGINDAGGFLSELIIHHLSSDSNIDPDTVVAAKHKPKRKRVQPNSIAAKLNGSLSNTGPQLVIVEKNYQVHSEPNPYSETVTQLDAGSGIYVINRNAGWYKVESINRQQGYIQVGQTN